MRLFIWYVLFFSFQKPGGYSQNANQNFFFKVFIYGIPLGWKYISFSYLVKSCIYWKARIDCFRDPKYMYDAPSHPRPLRY